MPQTVQVAVNDATFHFDKLYSYLIPEEFCGSVYPGSMVLVPFGRGNRPRMAVALGTGQEADTSRLKALLDVAPEEARLTEDLLRLVYFLKERTFCTYYEAVKAIIPYGAQYRPAVVDGRDVLQSRLERTTERLYSLAAPLPEKPKPTTGQKKAAELLQKEPLRQKQLAEQGVSRAVLDGLVRKGVVKQETVYKTTDLFDHILCTAQLPELTAEQQQAFAELAPCIQSGNASAALLYGVTGSGKTSVFLRLIEETLALGRTALILVPEIGLTPQMIYKLKSAFGNRVAVQHSALNNTERLLQWRMIQEGGADIVVGTRSAVFAPLHNIGLIVIDEEQEHTYRSESAPRFSAHDVAKQRAAENGALLLLASATPSTESYYAAQQGKYCFVTLKERYGGCPLPEVEMVDMRRELANGNAGEISVKLAAELKSNLDCGQQSILLLNRRGYRTVAACTDCGHVIKCQSCSVPMVYHKASGQLLCHYCGRTLAPAPTKCPECGGKLQYTGFGTQRAEEELGQLFPKARILRMDQDSTGRKNAHEKMLAQFAAGDYDILLGTQMVAKGLDFARVTLVGVLGVDSLLVGQGFRSFERVFSLLTQVVGRGGRADLPGRAVIQTVDPNHPVLQLAARQDYDSFYKKEIMFRKLCLYPPFCAVCVAAFSGTKEHEVAAAAARFSAILGQQAAKLPGLPLRVLGPTPMSILMINDHYRYKLTIKCRNDAKFRKMMTDVMGQYGTERLPAKATVTLDMNSDGE